MKLFQSLLLMFIGLSIPIAFEAAKNGEDLALNDAGASKDLALNGEKSDFNHYVDDCMKKALVVKQESDCYRNMGECHRDFANRYVDDCHRKPFANHYVDDCIRKGIFAI